jgi:hypothetical protein
MRVTGKVHRISLEKGERKTRKETVCIVNICDLYGNLITNHQWFMIEEFKVSIRRGDIIEFTAKVGTYIKGRWNSKKPVINSPNLKIDYALKYPREVRVIRRDGTSVCN